MNTKRRILVVEDDPSILFGLGEVLQREGFETVGCERGDRAESAVAEHRPCLIILDVMLPGRNGFDVCRGLRSTGIRTPILMLTAKGQELDKVIGLDSGADDYVTKPFGVRELVARVHALMRRVEGSAPASRNGDAGADGAPFHIGSCSVHPRDFQIEREGRRESLTPKEMGLLELLHARRGEALNRDELLDKVWGLQYFGTTRTVDQTVAQLRKKIGDAGPHPRFLVTVHGVGYRLERDAS